MQLARTEDQILLCVARRSLDVAAAANLRQLVRADLDWNYLVSLAQRHRTVPGLYYHLVNECPDAIPPPVRAQLEQLNSENTRSSLLLTGELLKLIDLLDAHGIAAVPFKGPTLALWAFGDVGRREFGDLDILVKKQNVPAVIELLTKEGFTPRPEMTAAEQGPLLRFDCSRNFANEKNVWLDVHWNFVAPSASVHIDTGRLWERLEPISVNQKQLKTVAVEDLLLILCLHGFTHLWERLSWISDVAALINSRKEIDWAMVLENADRMGSRRILALGLYLASNLLAAPVPAEVWTKVPADANVLALAGKVQHNLFAEPVGPVGILGEVRMHLAMKEGKREKAKSGLRLLATPKIDDWKMLPLPSSLFFLYYALRPLRLTAKYATKLILGARASRPQ
jgi:hypothetical protein